eukprot:TRINITY_DN2284_c2_g2_i1.p1 TRINITY_DN2284_c2_g2~~TRINITY_DN2284_c2_g2_i1.p1  ORF type:complete len:435 (+),score=71.32 TRINITY_DN2284_c2_g2_i1:317-1621(+)
MISKIISRKNSAVYILFLYIVVVAIFMVGTVSSHIHSVSSANSSNKEVMILGFGGDVNLNPNLTNCFPFPTRMDLLYPWGDVVPFMNSVDLMMINHESTIANMSDPNWNPASAKFQDPIGWESTWKLTGAKFFMSFANNHQFDFGTQGTLNTYQNVKNLGFPWGGIGLTDAEVRSPAIVSVQPHSSTPKRVAIFTLVAQVCDEFNHCTCGSVQCYPPDTQNSVPGLWLIRNITDETISETQKTIEGWLKERSGFIDYTVVMVHVGPKFLYFPTPQKVKLLRALVDAGADMVLASGTVNIQYIELYKSKPIVFNAGQFLFRHYPGVDNRCSDIAKTGIPCTSYRPELGFLYKFQIEFKPNSPANVTEIQAYPIIHSRYQANFASPTDSEWLMNTYNMITQSGQIGTKMVKTSNGTYFNVVPDVGPITPYYDYCLN